MNISLKKPIVYVTRDIERALGIEPVGNYFIVSNDSKYGREIALQYPSNVWLVKKNLTLDTFDLLSLSEVQQIISNRSADVLVFQNTPRIERLAADKKWGLLNPSAALAQKVEEKISQVTWLGDDAALLPPHRIDILKNVRFEGKRFVLQFNHSHTGQGTYVIDTQSVLDKIVAKFPDRECRVTDFVDGPVFTVNAVVGKEVFVGNPSYQITGLAPWTDLPFSTIGNDFALPYVYGNVAGDIKEIAIRIGARLMKGGWRGLFGIDVVYDEKTKKTYLLEINARQPASAVFESSLEKKIEPKGLTIFEAHIRALLKEPAAEGVVKIKDGAQIVKRVTSKKHTVGLSRLRAHKLSVIEYENTALNKELFRIQSNVCIMKSHNILNEQGDFIRSCIS